MSGSAFPRWAAPAIVLVLVVLLGTLWGSVVAGQAVFNARLSGPLYQARIQPAAGNAPEQSYLTADVPFTVRVGGERGGRADPVPAARAAVPPASDPAALRIVQRAAVGGALRPVVQGSRLLVRDAGTGRGVVTVLADVRPALRDVSAVLPQAQAGGPFRMHARSLRDLVIDVDVAHRRIIGIQPGPASQVTRWSAVNADWANAERSEDQQAAASTPRRLPHLVKLNDHGPAFLSQDGGATLGNSDRDWPVSLVFSGAATITKVKAGLRRLGLVRTGNVRYLAYRTAHGVLRFDSDRGLKGRCDANGTDVHVRLYAPPATDRFTDHVLGRFVVATVHLDHRDGCGTGPQLFGFSEHAERLLASMIRNRLGWAVRIDQYPLGNAEPLRRDAADATHIWQSDGLATGIIVP